MKENQPQLCKNLHTLFALEYPQTRLWENLDRFSHDPKVNKGHRQIETRILTTREMLNAYAAWPGLAQVYRLERQFQWRRNGRCYRTSCEVEFSITSLPRKHASPSQLLQIRRAHWGIETGLHYRRDVTLKEDATRVTIGTIAIVMASLNNLVLVLIRQANFHNAA